MISLKRYDVFVCYTSYNTRLPDMLTLYMSFGPVLLTGIYCVVAHVAADARVPYTVTTSRTLRVPSRARLATRSPATRSVEGHPALTQLIGSKKTQGAPSVLL
jgi:hypothetical protein